MSEILMLEFQKLACKCANSFERTKRKDFQLLQSHTIYPALFMNELIVAYIHFLFLFQGTDRCH